MSSEKELESWVEETTAFDRVKSVATSLSEARPPSYIAEESCVSENTARSHLQRLEDLDILCSSSGTRPTLYYPNPLYTRMKEKQRLLERFSQDELLDKYASLQKKIEDLQDEYDASGPGELRKKATECEDTDRIRELIRSASDWELAITKKSIISEIVDNFEEYESYSNPAKYFE